MKFFQNRNKVGRNACQGKINRNKASRQSKGSLVEKKEKQEKQAKVTKQVKEE